jgi:hypothetical protein
MPARSVLRNHPWRHVPYVLLASMFCGHWPLTTGATAPKINLSHPTNQNPPAADAAVPRCQLPKAFALADC